jgi:DNA-binding CsgD family transcriptional regulator
MLRLVQAVHEAPPDPAARRRLLLERVCALLRADAGVSVTSQRDAVSSVPGGPVRSTAVSVVRYGMTEEDARGLASRYGPTPDGDRPPRRRFRPSANRRRGAGRFRDGADASADAGTAAEHVAESAIELPGIKLEARLTLIRRRPRGRRFSVREKAALDLIHSELAWVYAPDLLLLSPGGLPLSPRQRQTLQLLLAGKSEKEIAAQLGLSHNTVHHYVKAIHRHFGVSSRSELLARWVRK